jgi:hypothetical protein
MIDTLSFKQNAVPAARACMLPAALIEARAAVFDPLNCLDIGSTARRTLFGILSFFNLSKPNSPIFPHRARLCADALLSSASTLYRGLKELENKGYITREQTRLQHNGRFYLSPIHLSEKALNLLGLLGLKNTSKKVIHNPPSSKMRDGLYIEHTNKIQSYKKTLQQTKICQKTRLPIPLLPLLDLDLSPSTICWLMSQAKKYLKRLEDVMTTAWQYISGLKGKSVVAYLICLLKKNQDFQAIRTSLEEGHAECIRKESAQARIDALDERFRGFSVITKESQHVGVFDPDTKTVQCPNGSIPINLRFGYALIEEEYRLIPSIPRWD